MVALYFKSVTANIASTGVVRLAYTDLISWRNALNNGNLTLGIDASNNLVYTGGSIVAGAGLGMVVTTPDGLHTYRIGVDNDGSITTEQLT